MKVKHALILVALGFCIEFVAVVMKILHWQGADIMLIVPVILKVTGVLILYYKIVTYEKLRDFMNW